MIRGNNHNADSPTIPYPLETKETVTRVCTPNYIHSKQRWKAGAQTNNRAQHSRLLKEELLELLLWFALPTYRICWPRGREKSTCVDHFRTLLTHFEISPEKISFNRNDDVSEALLYELICQKQRPLVLEPPPIFPKKTINQLLILKQRWPEKIIFPIF
jgi:hypothetical protein